MELPKSNPARISLAVIACVFFLIGTGPTAVGFNIVDGFLSVLALVSLGTFGLWGLIAVAAGSFLAVLSHNNPNIVALVTTLVILVVRLGLWRAILARFLSPFTPEQLKAQMPVIILSTFAVKLAFAVLAFALSGRLGMLGLLLNVNLVIDLAVQFALGYFVVLPGWIWVNQRGVEGAIADAKGMAQQQTASLGQAAASLASPAPGGPAGGGIFKPKVDAGGFAVADYGVPHCKYEKTAEGFIVTFNKTSMGFHQAIDTQGGSKSAMDGFVALIVLAFISVFWIFHKSAGGTRIEVTGDAVIIDKKKMSRDDFGGFSIDSTFKAGNSRTQVTTLGYSFGNRSFPFGGAWDDRQASEVASSLNSHLRRTPRAGDEGRASPEMLRAARPTDF